MRKRVANRGPWNSQAPCITCRIGLLSWIEKRQIEGVDEVNIADMATPRGLLWPRSYHNGSQKIIFKKEIKLAEPNMVSLLGIFCSLVTAFFFWSSVSWYAIRNCQWWSVFLTTRQIFIFNLWTFNLTNFLDWSLQFYNYLNMVLYFLLLHYPLL